MQKFAVSTIGYPRIGPNRQMKWALEKYWAGKITSSELQQTSSEIAMKSINEQFENKIDIVCVGSHTLYDHILDWTIRFGCIPKRFKNLQKQLNLSNLDVYFAMARGRDEVHALDMTKWFDTNYHNITPEIDEYTLQSTHPNFTDYFTHIEQAIDLIGKEHVSAEVIGPFTFAHKSILEGVTIEQVITHLTPIYTQLFKQLDTYNIVEIQIHEPALVLEEFHTHEMCKLLTEWYKQFNVCTPFNLVTYFDDVGELYTHLHTLQGVSTLSLDFTRGKNIELLHTHGWPSNKTLGAGIIDGRSVWNDTHIASKLLSEIVCVCKNNNIRIQPSSSLMFLPLDVDTETHIDPKLKHNLRFSKQKLHDLHTLSYGNPYENGTHTHTPSNDTHTFTDDLFKRSLPVKERRSQQLTHLKDKKLITSTIGSFPQTSKMRQIRLQFRKGAIDEATYNKAVDEYIAYCIGVQEGIGLDILVHGEPERSDMVEYFAEKMDGFLFTTNGWVQSYGSRYVRPPIIYGDVCRKENKAMTVREYLESTKHTQAYVKGMLTGPTTIINWSFPRKDVCKKIQTFQIAMALRNEICDLEANGCQVIQVDEPALREGLPLKKSNQQEYLKNSVDAFRLTTAVAQPSTHIVTHFCYSEFGDILNSIKEMDADQITIENSRSDNAMLKAFAASGFENIIAPGIYDVHSPVIPSVCDLKRRLNLFLNSNISTHNLMIVPDCGLKTRKWDEVINSLRNVVKAVDEIRNTL